MADWIASPGGRADLRRQLQGRYDWLANVDIGPQAVTAGECDVCGQEARMVQPCGPPPSSLGSAAGPDWALGRRCAEQAGVEGWCDGHRDQAVQALAWLRQLSPNADVVARLWWLATGEVRPDPQLLVTAQALVANAGPGLLDARRQDQS
ncbi:hypothetical protein BH24ACT15_BH24ACT15_28370 [soil metagenome]